MIMRCLHCTKLGGHTPWCPARGVPNPTTIMPAVETDDGPPEMPVAAHSARRGAPAWAAYLVALGTILVGLCLVGLGVHNHVTEGGVEKLISEQFNPHPRR